MLLRRCCPCACPSSSAVELKFQAGSLLASAGIISLPDLSQEPSTACKAGVDTVHLHRPDIRDRGKLLPVARLSVDAQGRSGWRISYPCVLLSICVHHSPKTTLKTSENWKRLSYNKPLEAGRWTVVRPGWPSNAVRVAIFYARCHRQPSMQNSSIGLEFGLLTKITFWSLLKVPLKTDLQVKTVWKNSVAKLV